MTLEQHLNNLAREPFAWGTRDCALVVADWIAARRGVDPAAGWRGRYASEAECSGLLRAAGHLPRIFARLAREHGIARTTAPRPGDVAVVRIGAMWFGAVMTPTGRWAVKAGDGLSSGKARVVAAWRV